jgi:hypothetical protein
LIFAGWCKSFTLLSWLHHTILGMEAGSSHFLAQQPSPRQFYLSQIIYVFFVWQKKTWTAGDSMRPPNICIKVEDSSPSPRKLPNLIPRSHTRARYPMSGPVPQTCALANAGQMRSFLPRHCNSSSWEIEPRPQGCHLECLTSQSSILSSVPLSDHQVEKYHIQLVSMSCGPRAPHGISIMYNGSIFWLAHPSLVMTIC